MASSFKRTYYNPTTGGLDVAYTVPAVTTAIALSAIVTPTNNKDKTVSIGIAPTGAVQPNWISRNIDIPNGSSVNIIPDKLALATGDRIVVNADTELAQLIQTADTMPIVNPKYMAVNNDGSVVLVGGDNGVARSTDNGYTFTMVSVILPVNSGFNLLRYFNNKFIYFVSGTLIYTSVDGVTWEVFAGIFPTSNVVGNDTKLVGINNGSMYESIDGTTWTAVTIKGFPSNLKTSLNFNINSISTNLTNSRFIACGDNGYVFVSEDNSPNSYEWNQLPTPPGVTENLYGVTVTSTSVAIVGESGRIITCSATLNLNTTFTIRTSGTSNTLRAICWTGSVAIAVGDNGTVLTSDANATTWTARTSNVTERLNGVNNQSTNIVAVGHSGTLITSANSGTTWTTRTSGTSEHLYSSFYSSTQGLWFVVGAQGTILTAPQANLATWTVRTSGTTETLYSVRAQGATTSLLICGSNGTLLYGDNKYSTFTFTPANTTVTEDIMDIGFGVTGNQRTCFVGTNGLIGSSTFEYINPYFESFYILPNEVTSGTAEDLNAVWFGNNVVVAVGNNGTILTSTTALTTWTARTSGTSEHLYGVFYISNVWVAVGANGAVTVGNASATTWTNQTAISANDLNAVHMGLSGAGFIAVGNGGVIFTSDAAGTTWTPQTNADTQDLFGVYHGSGQGIVAVGGSGSTGRVLTAPITGGTWTVRSSGVTSILRAVFWYSNLWTAVGDSGVLTTSANITTWTVGTSGTTENLRGLFSNGTSALGLINPITTASVNRAIVGDNGTFLTMPTGNTVCCTRKHASTTRINSFIDITTGTAVSVGSGGKILAYSVSNGGWQETYALKPHEINGIGFQPGVGAIAGGTGGMVYTSPAGTTQGWNNLAFSTQPDNNIRSTSKNSNASHVTMVGNNGFIAFHATMTGNPSPVANMTDENLTGVIFNGVRNVVIGENGLIMYGAASATTYLLTKANSGTTEHLNDIITGGGVTVIVGNNGTILTGDSTGITWTPQTSGTSENLYGVTFNSNDNTFIAVGDNGTILTGDSTGVTWTPRISGVTERLNGVYVGTASSGAAPVAVGNAGVVLYADLTGVNWTQATPVVPHNLRAGVPANTGSANYIVGDGYTILDSTSLQPLVIRSTFSQDFVPLASAASTLGGVGSRPVYVGRNGMLCYTAGGYSSSAASNLLIPIFTGTYSDLNDVVFAPANFIIAVGSNGTAIGSVTTNNYRVFSWYNSGITETYRGVMNNSTAYVVAVGDAGKISILTTFTPNASFSQATTVNTENLMSVAYASTGTTWVACGENGRIVTNSNANPATGSFGIVTSGTSNHLRAVVAFSATPYVAVGDNGTILTAPSGGATWTLRTSGTTEDLLATEVGAGTTAVAVGRNGTYLYSADTVTWAASTTSTVTDLLTAVYIGGPVIFTDSVAAMYIKDTYNATPTTHMAPKMNSIELALSGSVLYDLVSAPVLGNTSYTFYYATLGNSPTSYTNTLTTPLTDITAIGDNLSDIFVFNQSEGNASYTSDFSLYLDTAVGRYTELIGDRILLGEEDVCNVPQTGAIAALPIANKFSLGPDLSPTTYFDRYNNVTFAITSSGDLWRIPDITSTTPRAGLQVAISVTEFT